MIGYYKVLVGLKESAKLLRFAQQDKSCGFCLKCGAIVIVGENTNNE